VRRVEAAAEEGDAHRLMLNEGLAVRAYAPLARFLGSPPLVAHV
jgi:hypothetical protein